MLPWSIPTSVGLFLIFFFAVGIRHDVYLFLSLAGDQKRWSMIHYANMFTCKMENPRNGRSRTGIRSPPRVAL